MPVKSAIVGRSPNIFRMKLHVSPQVTIEPRGAVTFGASRHESVTQIQCGAPPSGSVFEFLHCESRNAPR